MLIHFDALLIFLLQGHTQPTESSISISEWDTDEIRFSFSHENVRYEMQAQLSWAL